MSARCKNATNACKGERRNFSRLRHQADWRNEEKCNKHIKMCLGGRKKSRNASAFPPKYFRRRFPSRWWKYARPPVRLLWIRRENCVANVLALEISSDFDVVMRTKNVHKGLMAKPGRRVLWGKFIEGSLRCPNSLIADRDSYQNSIKDNLILPTPMNAFVKAFSTPLWT